MMDNLRYIGTIVNSKGIEGGQVVVDCPQNFFLPKESKVFIGFSEKFSNEYILLSDFCVTVNTNKTELYLKDIDTKEKTFEFRNKGIFVDRDFALIYNENFLFLEEILGLKVINIENKEVIGEVIDVWELPANNVWLVKTKQGELPLPVIDDVIKDINLTDKEVLINLIDGLMDLLNNKDNDDAN